MVKIFKKTFSLSDLWVTSNDRLSDFHASSWQRGDAALPLLLVRFVLLAAALGIMAWSLSSGASAYWLAYLTNWGLLLLTFMTLSAFVVSCMAFAKEQPEYGEVPWYIGTYWIFYNINISLAFIITALYWILLYDEDGRDEQSIKVFMLDFSTHGLNSCISFLELLLSRTPVRILHVYQPVAVGLWYSAFSAIYYAAGGTDAAGNPYIYPVLDWREGKQALVMLVISIISLIIVYCLIYGFALCRDKISLSLVRTKSHDLPNVPPDHTRVV